MKLYSQFNEGDRKATVNRVTKHWDEHFNSWNVELYINDKLIQKISCKFEHEAEKIAENFVNSNNSNPILLNESTNG